MSRSTPAATVPESADEQLHPDVITQYQENQTILDRRVLMAPLFRQQTQFQPRSNHKMHGELVIHPALPIESCWLMLSAIVSPFLRTFANENGVVEVIGDWLPSDVVSVINGFLITSSKLNENMTDRFYKLGHSLFRPGIVKERELIAYQRRREYIFEPSIADVIDAIVCGNFKKTKQFLKNNPGLLIQCATATGPSGVVTENVTPLQAAILSGDKELFELIARMLLSHQAFEAQFEDQRLAIYARRLNAFRNETCFEADRLQALLKSGATNDTRFGRPITQEYIDELSTRCDAYQEIINSNDFETIFDTYEAAQQNAARDLLGPIFEAINNATANEVDDALTAIGADWQETDNARATSWAELTLTEKINRFRYTLKTSVPNAETLLQAALDGLGHTHCFNWIDRKFAEQDLCWEQVVGSIMACLPARYAHALSFGLREIADKKGQCPRSFKVEKTPGVSFYNDPRLGFTVAIYGKVSMQPLMNNSANLFSQFRSNNNEVFGTLSPPRTQTYS